MLSRNTISIHKNRNKNVYEEIISVSGAYLYIQIVYGTTFSKWSVLTVYSWFHHLLTSCIISVRKEEVKKGERKKQKKQVKNIESERFLEQCSFIIQRYINFHNKWHSNSMSKHGQLKFDSIFIIHMYL